MLAEVYVVKGREAGKALELGPGSSVSCGRALSNDLRVRDPQVSRVHCRIECGEDEVRIKDSSGNGTFVNDERLEGERVLRDGDQVRLGSTELRVLIESLEEAREHQEITSPDSLESGGRVLARGVSAGSYAGTDGDEDSSASNNAASVEASLTETAIENVPNETEETAVQRKASSLSAAGASAPRARARRPDAPEPFDQLPPPLGPTARAAPPGHDATQPGLASLREIVPGYRIESKLGGGGRRGTVVYRALQISIDRPVALKVLLPAAASREQDLGRFLRESAAIARLPHPNIVTIHDAGRSGDRRFIVMELLGGGSAEDRLDDGPFSEDEAVGLGLDIARALAFAHGHGIVHRGVRPANVLRDAFGTWKLVDFGSTRDLLRGGGGETSFLDTPPAILGYVAPEQLEKGGGDARSDVYGLGAVLYHALVGRPPYTGTTLGDFVRALSESPEPPLEPLVQSARSPVVTIVRRCLLREPVKRYPSGEAVLHELMAVRAADAPRLRPPRPVKP